MPDIPDPEQYLASIHKKADFTQKTVEALNLQADAAMYKEMMSGEARKALTVIVQDAVEQIHGKRIREFVEALSDEDIRKEVSHSFAEIIADRILN